MIGFVAGMGGGLVSLGGGSLIVPLAGGALLGWLLPRTFVGDTGTRSSFVLFIAIALSISALPVIAKVLFLALALVVGLGAVGACSGGAASMRSPSKNGSKRLPLGCWTTPKKGGTGAPPLVQRSWWRR